MDPSHLHIIPSAKPTIAANLHKTGLLQLLVGTSAMVLFPDSPRPKQLPVRSREACDYAASAEKRTLKFVARCLTCNKDFKDEVELTAAHDEIALHHAGAAHIWAFFSVDPIDPEAPRKTADLEKEINGCRRRREKLVSSLATVEDPDEYESAKKRIAVEDARISDAERTRHALVEGIIGLASYVEWTNEPLLPTAA